MNAQSILDAVNAVLDGYPGIGNDRHVEVFSRPGFSGATIFRVESSSGVWCCRCWGPNGPDISRLRWIHDLIRSVANLDFIAKLRTTNQLATFIECDELLWEVTDWMPGNADFNEHSNASRMTSMVNSVFRLHESFPLGAAFGPSPAIASRAIACRRLAKLQQRAHECLFDLQSKAQVDCKVRVHQFLPMSEMSSLELHQTALSAIERLAPQLIAAANRYANCQFRLQPVLRDLWHDHVLFVDDIVSGIIDFGALQMDVRECDWARLIGSLRWNGQMCWVQSRDEIERQFPACDLDWDLIKWLHQTGTVFAWFNWLQWLFAENGYQSNRVRAENRFHTIAEQILLLDT